MRTTNGSVLSNIAVIGTGRMGSALVKALRREGFATAVWNRTASKAAPLADVGARPAASVLDAVTSAELVIINVLDYGAGDALLRAPGVAEALRGKTLVELTSGSPRLARDRAAWAAARGIAYLDGAIMGTPDFIGTPGGTILYGGPAEAFERSRPALLALGGSPVHVGADPGHASALDSALLSTMWGGMFGLLLGAAICDAEGVPLETYERFSADFKPVVDAALADLMTRLRTRRYTGDPEMLASLEAHHAAFQHLVALCAERGIAGGVPEAFNHLLQQAMQADHAGDDFAVMSRFLGASASVKGAH